jgi:HEAT repeats
MTGNSPETIVAPEVKRLRASSPILILAVLFVTGAFLTWYFTWFGRDLSEADISEYLVDEKHPRKVQHALLQIQQRLERGDPSVKQWYPQVVGLASHPETEFRLTAAWLMGFDSKSQEFHQSLLKLIQDPEPIVRRNAALALVRFGDSGGRPELVAMLSPYVVTATAQGDVASTLKEGAPLARGTLLARITQSDNKTVEVRSPLPGKLERIIAVSGSKVVTGAPLMTINSDEDSLWEALRGLSLIGGPQDIPSIEPYANGSAGSSDRIKQQAALTIKAIQARTN